MMDQFAPAIENPLSLLHYSVERINIKQAQKEDKAEFRMEQKFIKRKAGKKDRLCIGF